MRLIVELSDPRRYAERVDAVATAVWLALRDWSSTEYHPDLLARLRGVVKRALREASSDDLFPGTRDLVFRSWNALERFEQELAGEVALAAGDGLADRPVLEILTRELPAVIRGALDVQVSRINPGAIRSGPVVPPAVRNTATWHHRATGLVRGHDARGISRHIGYR